MQLKGQKNKKNPGGNKGNYVNSEAITSSQQSKYFGDRLSDIRFF